MPKRLACLVCSLLSSATAFQAPPRVVNAALGSRSEHVPERRKHVLSAAKRALLPDLAQVHVHNLAPRPREPRTLVEEIFLRVVKQRRRCLTFLCVLVREKTRKKTPPTGSPVGS